MFARWPAAAICRPRDAIRAGICLLTEDRKAQGLVLGQSVRVNFGLPNLPGCPALGFVHGRRNSRPSPAYRRLRIKVSHADQPARKLSGGNQQKVVLAKWLAAPAARCSSSTSRRAA